MLVIGLATHNATEGFVAPLAADQNQDGTTRRPSWGFLLALGIIGGAPTSLGTWLGQGYTSDALSVTFLTLAAGSIICVIVQLLAVAAKAKRPDLVCYGLLLGLSPASPPTPSSRPAAANPAERVQYRPVWVRLCTGRRSMRC